MSERLAYRVVERICLKDDKACPIKGRTALVELRVKLGEGEEH